MPEHAASPAENAPIDATRLRAWSALVTLYQGVLQPVVRTLEREHGLDSGAYSALAYLARAEPPGRLSLRDLQELLHVRYSQPGVSRLVQRLEADGLVRRLPHPDDGRSAVVALTAAGRRRYRRAERTYHTALAEHFGQHLSVTQARDLTRLCEAIREA